MMCVCSCTCYVTETDFFLHLWTNDACDTGTTYYTSTRNTHWQRERERPCADARLRCEILLPIRSRLKRLFNHCDDDIINGVPGTTTVNTGKFFRKKIAQFFSELCHNFFKRKLLVHIHVSMYRYIMYNLPYSTVQVLVHAQHVPYSCM